MTTSPFCISPSTFHQWTCFVFCDICLSIT